MKHKQCNKAQETFNKSTKKWKWKSREYITENLNEKELRWQEENFDVVNKLRILRFNGNLRGREWENVKIQTDESFTFSIKFMISPTYFK